MFTNKAIIYFTFEGRTMYIKDKYDIATVVKLFQSGDFVAQKTYILSACPPSSMRNQVLNYINPDRILTSLTLLADTYCRGIDCQLGITLGQTSYQLSQKAFETTSAKIHRLKDTNKAIEHTKELQDLEDWLALIRNNAANSAVSCAVGFQSLGQHRKSIKFVTKAIQWLKAKEYYRAVEWFKSHGYNDAIDTTLTLTLKMIESYIELAKYDKAIALIDQTNWNPLFTEECFEAYLVERQIIQALIQKLMERIQQSIILPPESIKDKEAIITFHEQILNTVKSIGESFYPEDLALFQIIEIELKQKIIDVPESISIAEWGKRMQSTMDRITDFISGGGKEFNQLQNQKRIRNATAIFLDSKTGHNPEGINQSVPILIQARDWAREHNFREDENDALWSLYLCYSRTQQEAQAIEVLQALRKNLEEMRQSISHPMKRAGILRKFPNLFGDLCQLLCRSNRAIELLDAIEGAKGRVLADVLTEKLNQPTSEKELSEPSQQIPFLMQEVNAHYLSYFVDDEATYAVLVTKDGSLHTQEIVIGKKQIQEWLDYKKIEDHDPLDPRNWGKTISKRQQKNVINLSESLAPLVSWLEPLATSGIIQQNDHICYCPDEELHLIPLHYLPFRGKPLVNYVSLSRIQGALALVNILKRESLKPNEFTVVQVWANEDVCQDDSEKKQQESKIMIAAFNQPGEWLNEQLTGEIVSETNADLPTVAKLNLSQRIVHFANHGDFPSLMEQEHSKKNPYLNSGLLLAKNGQLPPSSKISDEAGLLSPQQVLKKKLDFRGSHVTLQACVSGRAKEGIGGDALGLEWAFLLNGASSSLASHWNVHAAWAAKFSIKFYQKWLVEKASRAVAWRETVLELMGESAQPYYWAAFSLSGDWR
ncbi:CHAT domain-containing protein [Capilliphycus salinus ALCB114379]|uniref:CHAT domain-containing protein n=1 Tax=Capilliphycus salinus TaxID=2768948 RepID=UPI0039A77120